MPLLLPLFFTLTLLCISVAGQCGNDRDFAAYNAKNLSHASGPPAAPSYPTVPRLPHFVNGNGFDYAAECEGMWGSSLPRVDIWVKVGPSNVQDLFTHWLYSLELFWSPCFGKIVVVTDVLRGSSLSEEAIFNLDLLQQFVTLHSDKVRLVRVEYEELLAYMPGRMVSGREGGRKYDLQQYFTFLADEHVEESCDVVALMDSDAPFIAPVLPSLIFKRDNNTAQLRLVATPTFNTGVWDDRYEQTTYDLLHPLYGDKFKTIGNFMSYFPVFVWRDSFAKYRQVIIRRYGRGSNDFKVAFHQLALTACQSWYSQFHIMLHISSVVEPERYFFDEVRHLLQDDYNPFAHVTIHAVKSALNPFAVVEYLREVKFALCNAFPHPRKHRIATSDPNTFLDCTAERDPASFQRILSVFLFHVCFPPFPPYPEPLRKKTSDEFYAAVRAFFADHCQAKSASKCRCPHWAGWVNIPFDGLPSFLRNNVARFA